ncbi:MAG: PAS domain S-box protein, partial [Bacteroidales bacterium]|nr:PAS domain S-box protein [Bacteroidales bacterium]
FFDIVNNIWTASPVLNNLFGIGDDYEKSLESWNEIVHPEHKDEMLNYFVNTVVKDRNPFFKEYKIKRINDGEERWVLGHGQLEYDKEGKVLTMIGTIQDITERKEFEIALQKSNRHWQTLTEATRILNSEMELKQILRYLVSSAMQLTGAQEGTAGMLREGKMVFREYNAQGKLLPIDYSFEEGYGVPGHVLETKRPYLANKAEEDEHVVPDIQKQLGFYNLVDTPIINRNGKVIGCFELHNKPGGFDDYDIMLLQNLASATAIAIENAQIIEQLKKTKQALISTESNLLSLINNRKESIWSVDNTYRLIVCNDFFKDSYRAAYNFDLKIGINLVEILTPELREFWKPKYDKALGGERLSFEFSEIILGEKIYLNVFLNPIIVGGEIKGVSALSLDITEKVTSERELKKSEEKFRKLFENHSAIHLLIDPDTGRIENANQAAVDFYGWTIDELKNMRIHDINTLGHDEIEKRIQIARKSNNLFFEFKHRTASRNIRDVEVFSSKVELFGKEFLHSIIHDISEKNESEKKLKLLAHSIEQSMAVVVITNQEGRIEYVNPAFTKITGFTFDEVQGKKPDILKSGHHSHEFYKHLWTTISSGNNWEGEFKNKTKNGDLYWDKTIISPLIDREGLITNYIAIKEDITEEKRMIDELIEAKEKAEESDVLKSAFLANMSHEIRTPLNGILGFTGLLTRQTLLPDHKRIEYGKIIEHCGQNLLHLINDVLDISKLESGQLKITQTTFNLTNTLKTTFKIYQRKIGESKKEALELKLKLPDQEIIFESDENRLNQVFSNLLDNAVKFTEKGEISFGISAIEPQKILFFVADSGIGIPQEKQEFIFDRFAQADPDIAINYGGTGLGLSIVKKIIHIMGGDLFLESETNKGAVFYFS